MSLSKKKVFTFFVIALFIGFIPLQSMTRSNAVFDMMIVPDEYPTIQDAIDNAKEGDIIYVNSGTYYENLYISSNIELTCTV